ncbi:MAG: DUF3108 domain-containing protein [Bacteroidales bacterium]
MHLIKIKYLLFILISFLFSLSAFSENQMDECAFRPGERLTYKAFYNWGVIWVYAADVEFEVSQKSLATKATICLDARANSIPRYDWFFKVRDNFRSFATFDKMQPIWAERNTSEGSLKIYESYAFNQSTNKIYSTIHGTDKPLTRDTINSRSEAYDVLSAVYNARNIDFSKYKAKDKIPVRIVLDGKIHSLFIRYLGKETIKDRHEKAFLCHKFSSFMVAGTAFKGGEDVTVWVTDDLNRIPILVEAKVLIGSVKAYLETADGLKYSSKWFPNRD